MTKVRSSLIQFMLVTATLALASACSPPRAKKSEPTATTPEVTAPASDQSKSSTSQTGATQDNSTQQGADKNKDKAKKGDGSTPPPASSTDVLNPPVGGDTTPKEPVQTNPSEETPVDPSAGVACSNDYSGEFPMDLKIPGSDVAQPIVVTISKKEGCSYGIKDSASLLNGDDYKLNSTVTKGTMAVALFEENGNQLLFTVLEAGEQEFKPLAEMVGTYNPETNKTEYTAVTVAPSTPTPTSGTATPGEACAPFMGKFVEESTKRTYEFSTPDSECREIKIEFTEASGKKYSNVLRPNAAEVKKDSGRQYSTLLGRTLSFVYKVKNSKRGAQQSYTVNDDGSITRTVFKKVGKEFVAEPSTTLTKAQ